MRSSHLLECGVTLLAGATWLMWEYNVITDAEAATALFAAVVALWTTLIYNVVRDRSTRRSG